MEQLDTSQALHALAILQSYFDRDNCPKAVSAMSSGRSDYAALAQDHLALRALRRRMFGVELSSEHCWDVIVTLYLSKCAQTRMSITDVSYATGISAATVIRWLNVLSANDMLVRTADPLDGRRTWISLTNEAWKKVEVFFARQKAKSYTDIKKISEAA